MKQLLTIFFVALFACAEAQVLVPKGTAQTEPRLARYSFCISLLPSPNSGPVSYGIHRLSPDGSVDVTFLRYETFLRQFGGGEESRANPDRIDYMELHNISQMTIKELWKLRYALYPFGKSPDTGWGKESGVPSEAQMQMLAKYGIERVGDVVYGENLINLLLDIQNPTWLEQYKAAR